MTQDPEIDLELERRVGRALAQLPPPKAPPMFASRVMARIHADAAQAAAAARRSPAAGARASFEWPVAVKVLLSFASASVAVIALVGWPWAVSLLREWHSPVAALARIASEWIAPALDGGAVWMAAAYVATMCVAGAGAASMLKHVALGGASKS